YMVEYKDKLYVTGDIYRIGDDTINDIAALSSNIFSPVGKGMPLNNRRGYYCLAVYDSTLYMSGFITENPNKIHMAFAKWDGKNWSIVAELKGTGIINAMAVFKGNLYLGGKFDDINGKPAHNIAVWDSKTFEPVGDGFTGKGLNSGSVHALCVYKGELYAAGSFTSSGGKTVMNIARLNLNGTKPSSTKSRK
ncbi:MAG TPA: delta-60 repeat domain-containing protein, partial [Bacteroidia bacterium]|nr:delta-60 repeat domain-containing protein [Bacteroidia bacterium]